MNYIAIWVLAQNMANCVVYVVVVVCSYRAGPALEGRWGISIFLRVYKVCKVSFRRFQNQFIIKRLPSFQILAQSLLSYMLVGLVSALTKEASFRPSNKHFLFLWLPLAEFFDFFVYIYTYYMYMVGIRYSGLFQSKVFLKWEPGIWQ